jgi:hypothetical protein
LEQVDVRSDDTRRLFFGGFGYLAGGGCSLRHCVEVDNGLRFYPGDLGFSGRLWLGRGSYMGSPILIGGEITTEAEDPKKYQHRDDAGSAVSICGEFLDP